MTARKKRGISFFITGGVFIIFGAITTITLEDPTWLAFIPVVIGFFVDFFGFQVVFPDKE